MNYSDIVNALNDASSFDLFRIESAIRRMLDDPQRILEVKKQLRKGQEIEYFEPEQNRTVKATILEFKRTKVLVRNIDDGVRWTIPYYFINVQEIDTTIVGAGSRQGLDRNEEKVGDRVGFLDRDNNEQYGDVTRLNQKTVTVNCGRATWRVSYNLLFKVLAPDIDALPGTYTVHDS